MFFVLRVDCKASQKSRGDVFMFVTTKNFNPGFKDGLIHINQELFESVWFQCKIFDNNFKIRHLVNVSYNPKKTTEQLFSDNLSTNIDFTKDENRLITLLSNYILEYLNEKKEKNPLILLQYCRDCLLVNLSCVQGCMVTACHLLITSKPVYIKRSIFKQSFPILSSNF